MKLPAQFLEVKTALAKLAKIDAVKEYRDKALAMEAYGLQAKDVKLIEYATEVSAVESALPASPHRPPQTPAQARNGLA